MGRAIVKIGHSNLRPGSKTLNGIALLYISFTGRTRIQTAPLDVMVYEDTEAKFTCTATTDPEEIKNLRIDWKKDGEVIDYSIAQRMFKNDMDNSLTISGTISLDTGKYTCVASNGLDEHESSAQLVVQGKTSLTYSVYTTCAVIVLHAVTQF